jgi:predicted HTH domain antitoxin
VILTLDISDSIARSLRLDGPDGPRRALEMLALPGYRTLALSRGQVSELLDLELNETMAFLKQHDCTHSITAEELEQQVKTFEDIIRK